MRYSIGTWGDRFMLREYRAGRVSTLFGDQLLASLYHDKKASVSEMKTASGISKRKIYRRLGPAVLRIKP